MPHYSTYNYIIKGTIFRDWLRERWKMNLKKFLFLFQELATFNLIFKKNTPYIRNVGILKIWISNKKWPFIWVIYKLNKLKNN